MQYAIWKHYYQHASIKPDGLINIKATSMQDAEDTAQRIYLELNPGASDEEAGTLTNGDYQLLVMDSDGDDDGHFDLLDPTHSQTDQRHVAWVSDWIDPLNEIAVQADLSQPSCPVRYRFLDDTIWATSPFNVSDLPMGEREPANYLELVNEWLESQY